MTHELWDSLYSSPDKPSEILELTQAEAFLDLHCRGPGNANTAVVKIRYTTLDQIDFGLTIYFLFRKSYSTLIKKK